MSFDPLAPYGPVIESTVRVVTWNVWGKFGADWEGRQAGLEAAAVAAAPDGAGAGVAVHVSVAGERGAIQLFTVMLDYPLGASGIRQAQVRQLAEFVAETAPRRDLVVVCGDFNAGPDSDEIRMLTGRSAPAVPGLVFYDAWEMAGGGSPGFTWSNRNPLAALGLFPDRRFDYILSAWPRRGGAGHPVRCSLLGVRPAGEQQISDHYGVVADLRY